VIHELRKYRSQPGSESKVHDRFRDVVLPLFTKHGMDVVGFWAVAGEPGQVVYLLGFDDEAAQASAWGEFQNDPWWRRAKTASEAAGPIVEDMSSLTLHQVDYWPETSRTHS
jgi:hypothetical protein